MHPTWVGDLFHHRLLLKGLRRPEGGAGRGCTGRVSRWRARTPGSRLHQPRRPRCVQRLGRLVLHLVSRPQIPCGSGGQPQGHTSPQRSACLDFTATELLPPGGSWTLVGGRYLPTHHPAPPPTPPGGSRAWGRTRVGSVFLLLGHVPESGRPLWGQYPIPPQHPGTLHWRPGDPGVLGGFSG